MEIDEEGSLKKNVQISRNGENGKRLLLPQVFDENGLDALQIGNEVELNMDKKNRVVFFRY